jgi:non-heme chloroperoxidase
VLLSAVTPLVLKTTGETLAACRSERLIAFAPAVLADRARFFKDLSAPSYGQPTRSESPRMFRRVRDSFWPRGMLSGSKAAFDYMKALSETDFTEDLKKFNAPTLILHGDDRRTSLVEDQCGFACVS